MNNEHQNASNNGVERFTSKGDCAADQYRTAVDVVDNMTVTSSLPLPPSTTVAASLTQELGGSAGPQAPDRTHHSFPTVGRTLSANQASGHISAVTAQLQATVAKLQSENDQIKTEIRKIVYEITSTSSVIGKIPSPEWCSALFSDAEAFILQSFYEELWRRHLKSTCEITPGFYAKEVQRHGIFWSHHRQMLKSHAVLKDDLQRLTRQLTNPLGPGTTPFLICLEDNQTPIVGPRAILDVLRDRPRPPVQSAHSPRPATSGGLSQTTPPVIPANSFSSNPNKRRLEQKSSSTSDASHSNVFSGAPTSPIPPPPKRRKLDDAWRSARD